MGVGLPLGLSWVRAWRITDCPILEIIVKYVYRKKGRPKIPEIDDLEYASEQSLDIGLSEVRSTSLSRSEVWPWRFLMPHI